MATMVQSRRVVGDTRPVTLLVAQMANAGLIHVTAFALAESGNIQLILMPR